MRWGRVRRVGRGTYAVSYIPRTTRQRFHKRAARVAAEARTLRQAPHRAQLEAAAIEYIASRSEK